MVKTTQRRSTKKKATRKATRKPVKKVKRLTSMKAWINTGTRIKAA